MKLFSVVLRLFCHCQDMRKPALHCLSLEAHKTKVFFVDRVINIWNALRGPASLSGGRVGRGSGRGEDGTEREGEGR